MKKIFITTCIIISCITVNAQTRNLNYYLEQAKKNSPLINKSQNNNKIIRLNTEEVKNILSKPKVNIEANVLFAPIISHDNNTDKFQWISEGANSYAGYDLAYSDGGQYQAFISIKQDLFTGSIYNSYSQQADIQTKLNKNQIILTEHQLKQLVSYQYILCLTAKKHAEISKSLSDKFNKQIKIMRELVKNAVYKQTDLMIMQIEAENYKMEYENYSDEYRKNISDLNLLCGINDTSIVAVEDINFKLSPDTIVESQFFEKYELDSMHIQAEQKIFEQKYKPRLSIFANAGMNAVYIPSFNRFGFAAGINFSQNIFDGNQKKFQRQKSFIKLQTLEFEKQNFTKKIKTNKEKYSAQIHAVEKQIDIVQNQLREYKKLLKLYTLELSQAQVSVMDFKNLIRDISVKKQENLRLKMQKQLLINAYNYWNF